MLIKVKESEWSRAGIWTQTPQSFSSLCTSCLYEDCPSDCLRLRSQLKEHYTQVWSFGTFFRVHYLPKLESKGLFSFKHKPVSEPEGKIVFLSFIIIGKEKKKKECY